MIRGSTSLEPRPIIKIQAFALTDEPTVDLGGGDNADVWGALLEQQQLSSPNKLIALLLKPFFPK